MSDSRPVKPLPSRSGLVRPTFRYGMSTRTPDPAFLPAGADVSEPDTSQTVAPDSAIVDTERDPLYGDGVEHTPTLDGLSGGHKSCSTSPTPPAEPAPRMSSDFPGQPFGPGDTITVCATSADAVYANGQPITAEAVRRSRLSRWQEQR